jgi:hypothetical protein
MQKGTAANTGTQEVHARFWFGNITATNQSSYKRTKSVYLKKIDVTLEGATKDAQGILVEKSVVKRQFIRSERECKDRTFMDCRWMGRLQVVSSGGLWCQSFQLSNCVCAFKPMCVLTWQASLCFIKLSALDV